MYCNLNDYELIYLYREKSERALTLLIEKYSTLINKMINEKGLTIGQNDAFQDSLIVLYKCIQSYDMNSDCSFFNYFLVCLKRQIFKNKVKEINYASMVISYDDSIYLQRHEFCEDSIEYEKISFNKDLDRKVFQEIIIENLSPRSFSSKYNIDIKKVYNTIYLVKSKIKNLYK